PAKTLTRRLRFAKKAPTKPPANCAATSEPASASDIEHRLTNSGKSGPSRVVTAPVSANSRYSAARSGELRRESADANILGESYRFASYSSSVLLWSVCHAHQ